MNCLEFQKLVNDFIFDKIEYSEELQEFIAHFKTCKNCREELFLYYTIHRGLGDVSSPIEGEETLDVKEELNDIIAFYEEYFTRQNKLKRVAKITVVVVFFVSISLLVYLSLM